MQLLNIRFSAIDESNFIVNARSDAGQAESRSSLPFYETKTKWRTTLIKILEISKFSHDKFSDEENVWMTQEGLLLSDGSGFSADYLEKIGRSLYKSLFPVGNVSDLLQRSIALAEQDRNPQLHIQIEFNAEVTELNRLPDYPWEMVHDGRRFLAHHNVTFSRYIAHLSAPPTLSAVSPINVLLVSSGASDEENGLDPLSKKEHEAVKKGLEKSQEDGHILFSEPEKASFKALAIYLTEHRGDDALHVLHFDGHGVFGKRCQNSECRTFHGNLKLEKCQKCGTALSASQGYLLFEPDDVDDELEANYVSAEEIGSLLRSIRHGDSESQQGGVRLAVLSACKSAYALGGNSVFNGVAQSLIGHGVPAVVAMQYTVSVESATAFAERFYRELGNKQSLVVATSQGRVAMQNVEHNQWYRLIFYLRWQANDGGQLFATVGDNSAKSQATKTISIPSNVRHGSTNFVGREKELAEIHTNFQTSQGVSVCAVEGMGGLGKSELALQYAQRYQKEYVARYWLSLREMGLAQAVVTMANHYLSLPEAMQSAGLEEQAAWYWQNWIPQEGEILLILDDVTDLKSMPKQARPLAERFQVLLTTRKRRLSSQFVEIPLGVISELEALELLENLLGKSRLAKELSAAKTICEYLGYLPLGLELAGRYLQLDEDLRLSDYQKQLSIVDDSLDLQETEEINATRGVLSAFELSWQELSPSTSKVAMLLGLFAPTDIAWHLIETMTMKLKLDERDVREARKQLNNLYLIKAIDEERTRFTVHSLTRQFLQWKLTQEPEINRLFRQVFVMSLLTVAIQLSYSPTQDLIAIVAPVIPHLDMLSREMSNDIPNPEKNLRYVLEIIARFYYEQGFYALAEDPYRRCLKVTQEFLGEQHPEVSISLDHLAELYRAQGRYEKAEPLYKQSLILSQEVLPDQHAISINNLALLYFSQARHEEAEPLHKQALEIRQKLLGENHPDVAQSLDNLGSLSSSQERYDEAESLHKQALEMRRKLLGENHPDVATSLNNLGGVYCSLGRYEEAEKLCQQSLTIKKEMLGERHPDFALGLVNLAVLYEIQEKYEEAEILILRSLKISRDTLGVNHPQFIDSLHILVEWYNSQEKYKETELLYQKVLALLQELLGDRRSDIATSLKKIAGLYRSQGRYENAEIFYQKILEMWQEMDSSPDVAASIYNLAALRYIQNRYDEAEVLFLQALEMFESSLGDNHLHTQKARKQIANIRAKR